VLAAFATQRSRKNEVLRHGLRLGLDGTGS
jgi:hypothetical protein